MNKVIKQRITIFLLMIYLPILLLIEWGHHHYHHFEISTSHELSLIKTTPQSHHDEGICPVKLFDQSHFFAAPLIFIVQDQIESIKIPVSSSKILPTPTNYFHPRAPPLYFS